MIEFGIENQDVKDGQTQKLRIGLRIEDNGVNIVTLDKDNKVDWYLLKLCSDGTFIRPDSLPDDIGLQVDGEGRVKEKNNDS